MFKVQTKQDSPIAGENQLTQAKKRFHRILRTVIAIYHPLTCSRINSAKWQNDSTCSRGMYFHWLTSIIGFQPSANEWQFLNSNGRTWEVRPEYIREWIIRNVSRCTIWGYTRNMRDILQICRVTLQCEYYTQNGLDNACSDQAYWPVQNLCNYWTKHGQSQG